MNHVWKMTTGAGEVCFFGEESLARACARSGGTVEKVSLRGLPLSVVIKEDGLELHNLWVSKALELALAFADAKVDHAIDDSQDHLPSVVSAKKRLKSFLIKKPPTSLMTDDELSEYGLERSATGKIRSAK